MRLPSAAIAAALALLLVAAGCASLAPAPAPRPAPAPPIAWRELACSEEGRPIRLALLGDARAPRTILLLGGVHGSEPAGPPLVEAIAAELAALPAGSLEGRRVAVIPALNPDGLERGSRRNARGVDLNRDLPTADARAGAPRAAETRALLAALEELAPDRIVSVHQPLRCVNWDGPAEALARAMAARSGYPARADIGYRTPGSLGTWAGRERGIETITLELGPGRDAAPHLREARGAILFAILDRDAPAPAP